MKIFLNPWALNLFYLVIGILAASSDENQYPVLTVILFLIVPNLLFYASSFLTRKIKQKGRRDQ